MLEREEKSTDKKVTTGIEKLDEIRTKDIYKGSLTGCNKKYRNGKDDFRNTSLLCEGCIHNFEHSKGSMKNYGINHDEIKDNLTIDDITLNEKSDILFRGDI